MDEKKIRAIVREEARGITEEVEADFLKKSFRISQNEAYEIDIQLKKIII